MLHWSQAHLLIGSAAILTPLILWAAKKYLPTLAQKYADIFLKAMVNPQVARPQFQTTLCGTWLPLQS